MEIRTRSAHPVIRPITAVFLTLELLFYATYLILDAVTGRSLILSDGFKYGGIFLCFLYTLFIVCFAARSQTGSGPRKENLWLLLAVFFVLFSDYCLLFTSAAIPGILLFCLVQCFYYIYLNGACRLWRLWSASAVLAMVSTLILWAGFGISHALVPLALFYLSMLVINIYHAWKTAWRTRESRAFMFAAGMVLYCLCDLNVGFMNAGRILSGPELKLLPLLGNAVFREISTFSMWFFYLPAQVLIAMSAAWPLLVPGGHRTCAPAHPTDATRKHRLTALRPVRSRRTP